MSGLLLAGLAHGGPHVPHRAAFAQVSLEQGVQVPGPRRLFFLVLAVAVVNTDDCCPWSLAPHPALRLLLFFLPRGPAAAAHDVLLLLLHHVPEQQRLGIEQPVGRGCLASLHHILHQSPDQVVVHVHVGVAQSVEDDGVQFRLGQFPNQKQAEGLAVQGPEPANGRA